MFPTSDALLIPYATNVNARLVAGGVAVYQLSEALVQAYGSAFEAYQAAAQALRAEREAGTESRSLRMRRDETRAELLRIGRNVYATVQSSLAVSDADKILLGVKVRAATNTSRPAPSTRPVVKVQGTSGRVVLARLLDEVSSRSRKPQDVSAAMVWVAVGPQQPASSGGWVSKGIVTKTGVQIALEDQLTESAATVWITAAWVGTRGQQGPPSTPVSVNLPAASATPVVNQALPRKMKIAA